MEVINKKDFLDMYDYSINVIGLSVDMITENAALKVIKNIDLDLRHTFAVICGITQKGIYGLSIARNLINEGKFVDIYILSLDKICTKKFKIYMNILKNMNSNIYFLETIEELENFSKNLNRVNTIIDAIVGIEWDNKFQGSFEYVIDIINKSRIYTISVDIPSGMDYDTGDVKSLKIDSDMVVTFEGMKKGLLNKNSLRNQKVIIEKIGLVKRGRDVRYKTY